ncbi:undecaprenyl diphosphate synthase [Thermosulfidibacter takaii ABI70S6]|uniref:Isoprenyl transferase n=1 Tax=Thermosulfidibacter takaii (strain DSM 17441 / JCM 13301 / NBRC 103674 / ABI70S6) TaxID=1298851 RepID=A0A0S3QVS9_THET7|nr:isoprenyl transferase [Thermosulfidibacter takaii]BAT72427.1 undecaprenyl diphosphate synthase [Thermosulfidibacter takaii ABI70S6]
MGIKGQTPTHVAIIMDGNGRWAQKRGLSRIYGHKKGVERVEEIIEAAQELRIKYLTLFAFSTENWKRPPEEVEFLMGLLKEYLTHKRNQLIEQNIRFNAMGRIHELPKKVVEEINETINATQECTGLTLNLALNYGGRAEIVDAARKLAKRLSSNGLRPEDIDEEMFSKFLYCPWIPEPDLLIRTSGEMRISNFMLWELAYTELYFTPVLWPDFTKEEFIKAIENYKNRERRFGGL